MGRDWFGLDAFLPSERFVRDGAVLYLLKEVASTNDFLLGKGDAAVGRLCTWDGWGWTADARRDLAPVAAPKPGTVVVARRQTAGRGRQGRSWVDCGGLHLSVVIPSHRAYFSRGFSVWLGLMVVLSLREDFNVDARLKWPNDILCGDRKLGGILMERTGSGDRTAVVAGLGLNLTGGPADFPCGLMATATSLEHETDRLWRPATVSTAIINRVVGDLDRFESEGWEPWAEAMRCLDCLLGQEVSLERADETFTGRAVGIDAQGRLQLETDPDTAMVFSAGNVHLRARRQIPTDATREET